MIAICEMIDAGIRVMSQDDKIAFSLKVVIADHLRSIGLYVTCPPYSEAEVKSHLEFLKKQQSEISIGQSYQAVQK